MSNEELLQELQLYKNKFEQTHSELSSVRQKLIEFENKHNQFLEAGNTMVWIADIDKNVCYFNNNWLKFTGRTLEQELGNGCIEGVHKDDFDACFDIYTSSFDKRVPYEMEYRLRNASDEYKWLLDIGTPNYNNSGEFTGYIGHCIDISKRKQTEIALAQSEEKYRSIFEIISDVYYEARLDGTILDITPSIEKLTLGQYKREEAIGMSVATVYSDPKEREHFYAKLLGQGRVNDYELTFVNKDGSKTPVSVSSAIIFDEKGSPQKSVGIMRDITDRKKVDEALKETLDLLKNTNYHLEKRVEERTKELETSNNNLKESIERLNKFTGGLPGAVFQYRQTPEGVMTFPYRSAHFYNLIQVDMLDVDNDPTIIFKNVHPDDLQNLLDSIQISANELSFWNQELRIILNDGSIRWLSGNAMPYKDGDDIISNGFLFDITEKKLMNEALIESELRFSQFMDYLPALAFLKDVDGRYIFTNRYMNEVLGAKDWLGKTTTELYPNEFGNKHTEDDKKLIELGYLISEGEVEHINGELHQYETQKFTINRLGKEPILGGISSDITVRKNAEKAILQAKENLEKEVNQRTSELLIAKELAEKNEEKFKLLFNSGNDPMFVRQLDSNNQFSNLIYVNDMATEKYGYSKDEFFEMKPNNLVDPITFHSHDLPGLIELIEKRKVTFESVHLTKNGDKMNVELSGRFFELEGENVVLYIIRDITDRKRSEKSAIESQRLMAIGEMASSIAHDFNNSLQAMRGNIDVLKGTKTFPVIANEYLEIIDGIISDVAIRVKSLQRFGDTKKIINEYSPAPLNKIIKDVILQLRPMWKDNLEKHGFNIDIQEEYAENLLILCNEGELKTVFYNIIKNSIESMGFGGTIKIETSKTKNKAIVTIQDTGDGMDEETKLKIFQPFYTTKGFEAGRGLGMSGVFSIVKSHSGNIGVKHSELGKGTTIELSFPINHSKQIKVTKKDIDLPVKNQEKLTVLVVEDIASIRDSFVKMISLLGHNCDKAESGIIALTFLENKSYDIVFTDLGMSEMSGWQLADIIKEKFEGQISVVVVSGWEVSEDETQKHGVSFAINKPFTFAEIKNVIDKIAAKKLSKLQ